MASKEQFSKEVENQFQVNLPNSLPKEFQDEIQNQIHSGKKFEDSLEKDDEGVVESVEVDQTRKQSQELRNRRVGVKEELRDGAENGVGGKDVGGKEVSGNDVSGKDGKVGSGAATGAATGADNGVSNSPTVATQPRVNSERKKSNRLGSKKYGLNVAPLNTPLKNRLETIGVIWHCVSIPSFLCLFLVSISMGRVVWLAVILPYFIWWYGFDMHTPTNGKAAYRYRTWIKNLIIWKWFVEYFPIEVHKAAELEPTFTEVIVEDEIVPDDEEDLVSEHSRTCIDYVFKKLGLRKRLNDFNWAQSQDVPRDSKSNRRFRMRKESTGPRYIFGYHPHGVISMGVMGLFATNIMRNEPFEAPLKWLQFLFHTPSSDKRILPGIGNVFPLTLTTQFTIPFYRDYLMTLGLSSASAQNIRSLINNGDNSVCLVVGGAQESLLNNMVCPHPKIGSGFQNDDAGSISGKGSGREIKLVLNKRRGFVKLAIELGNVSLVPTFGFGEADIFRLLQPKPGSWGYKFQRWMKDTFSFTVPFFSARGVFIYDFGFLPFRNPINVCMGNPIYVPKGVIEEYNLKHPELQNEVSPGVAGRENAKSKSSIKAKIPPALVDHYHKLYVDELKRVYEANKAKYGYEDVELNIIE